MSYDEYLDLYQAAQENSDALYYVVSFDVVNSKELNLEKRKKLQENIFVIMQYVYNKLLIKEVELNRPVVIDDDRFYRPWDFKNIRGNESIDPLIIGDCFQFTVLKGTVIKEEIVEWVEHCKKYLKMEEEFHVADGYYETNEYGEGNRKLYRGYCLQILGTIHKKELQKKLNLLKKTK